MEPVEGFCALVHTSLLAKQTRAPIMSATWKLELGTCSGTWEPPGTREILRPGKPIGNMGTLSWRVLGNPMGTWEHGNKGIDEVAWEHQLGNKTTGGAAMAIAAPQQPHNAVPLLPDFCFPAHPQPSLLYVLRGSSLVKSYGPSAIDHGPSGQYQDLTRVDSL